MPGTPYTEADLAIIRDVTLKHHEVATLIGRTEKAVERKRAHLGIYVGRTWHTGKCHRGHELTEGNIYTRPNGSRECRKCRELKGPPRSWTLETCAKGHRRTPENTVMLTFKSQRRSKCLDCQQERDEARWAKLAAKYPPVVDLPGEEWRDVVGFEGRYSVSNLGRVRSESAVWVRDRRTYQTFQRILVPYIRKNDGRVGITLRHPDDKYPKPRQVHRLVLEAFVGPCPPGMVCCHWDDVPTNNRLSNLRWDTQSENEKDKARNAARRMPIEELRAILAERELESSLAA